MRTMTANIAAPLADLARLRPESPALIVPRGTRRPPPWRETRLTFKQLDDESDRLARGLLRLGLTRGMRAALLVPPSPEFFALVFALFKAGAVVVLVDPGMGVAGLGKCLAEAAPEAFIGTTKAHLARILFRWPKPALRVTVGPRLLWGGVTLSRVRREGAGGHPVLEHCGPDDPAAVLFTSGSTGPAKGAMYTHGIFQAQVAMLRREYGIEPGEIDLPTFPLFGLFGPALGMTAVLPEMDFTRPARADPVRILNAVAHYGVTNLFGSPALLRRVGFSREAETRSLPSLRRVLSAGAPVPAGVLRQFSRLLAEGVQIHTPYGATEALPVATIGSREVLEETASLTAEGKGVCVGRPVEGMEARVIRLVEEPIAAWDDSLALPAGEIGEIVARGPVVTRSYCARPAATALHKIHDGEGLWHRMGDVGYLDEEGRLWFCGRKSQRVETAGGTMFTIPCEGIANTHPAVLRSALVGVPGPGGTEPVLCVELEEDSRRIDKGRFLAQMRELLGQHEITRAIKHVLIHPGFPVDIRHNAKIFREKLAPWAARQLR
ncbi:MAG: AMP-binding protein [Gemmataceae bacterium]|nr:AMP-binding protein [Gemmataceae bacterium]